LIGTKHQRKLKKFSDSFNEKFNFFLKCRKSNLIDFCGEKIEVVFDINSPCAKECFRLFEDGYYSKGKNILKSKHPNILKNVIEGKKGWGLWLNEWSLGISECNFTKEEILNIFKIKNITIPESFLIDFENRILKYKIKRNENELKRIKIVL